MPRPLTWAAAAAAAALAAAAMAAGPAAAAPTLDSLRLPRMVQGQQGHARMLVGVRLSQPASLTAQVIRADSGAVVRTATDASPRRAGRAYLLLDAVDGAGFQLPAGVYRLRIQATDAEGAVSAALQGAFTLRLTPPRGRLDAYTIPVWRAFRRSAGTAAPGHLVVAVTPRGAAAAAGIRRGDVIRAIGGTDVRSAGALAAAQRNLPARTGVRVDLVRRGSPVTVTLRPRPDWERAPDYGPALRWVTRREPRVFAYAAAQARQLIESGEADQAAAAIARWPAGWRASAPGQLLTGDIRADAGRWRPALGAYSRARARDRRMGAAEIGRGTALAELDRRRAAIAAYRAAAAIDPADPVAHGFLAYALLRDGRPAEAAAAAGEAVRLDKRYAEGFLPLGIALLGQGNRADGVKALRRGLLLLEDSERAARLIRTHLEPADP